MDKWATLITEGEANGCYPCDTCAGFRAAGSQCACCSALRAENARLREERDKERRARIDAEADYTVCLAERDALRARVEALGEVGGRLHDAMRVFDTGCLHSHRVRDARAAWRILTEKPDAK